MKSKLFILIFALALLCCGALNIAAQETTDDTLQIRTRVVFLDALVKDKRTGQPIANLKEQNFQVYDEGKPRSISYFGREARKPLALLLVLDLRDDGAGRFLRRPEIFNAIAASLSKLSPEDEVAVLAVELGDEPVWLAHLTRDRAQVTNALASIPSLVTSHQEAAAADSAKPNRMTIETNSGSKGSAELASTNEHPSKPEDVESVMTFKGKDAVVTRTVKKDGTITTVRESKGKRVTLEMSGDLDLFGATQLASNMATQERPNSRVAVVWVSDGLTPIFFEQRPAIEEMMVRSNVIFNSVMVDMRTLYKFLLPVTKPITNWVGISVYGSAQYLAKQTGGEVVRVHSPDDYADGLRKIIDNLTERYSLGFKLDEQDQEDGRLHQLEVRVNAPDEKGKTRKLLINARKGYYVPKANGTATASSK